LGLHCYAVSTHPDEVVLEPPLKKILDPPMSVQHALRQWSSTPGTRTSTGPRNYKMCTGSDNTRFLGMWLVDSSHGSAVASVLPGHGKIVSSL